MIPRGEKNEKSLNVQILNIQDKDVLHKTKKRFLELQPDSTTKVPPTDINRVTSKISQSERQFD
jgi:hypothetical protein